MNLSLIELYGTMGYFAKGIVWILALMSIYATTLGIKKGFDFRRSRKATLKFSPLLAEALEKNDFAEADRLVNEYSKSHLAAAFHSVDEALARYLRDVAPGAAPPAAVLAIAGQVTDGRARFSNLPWTADAAALRAAFSFRTVELINDFVAQALSAPRLAPEHLRPLGRPSKAQPGVIAVIGAGTGFGAAGLAPGPAAHGRRRLCHEVAHAAIR